MSNIQVHCRIRPAGANPQMQGKREEAHQLYQVDYNDNILQIKPPKLVDNPNKKSQYNFQYSRIYDDQAKQEDIYDHLVKPLLPEFLKGINCTVFCYGQTGSGKTHTMTGGTASYKERGLMPRAIENLFNLISQDDTREYSVFCSYLQIMNDGGYDLLSQSGQSESRQLDDLEKVKLQEDGSGEMHVSGLSAHQTANIEAALNVLWNGDLNRIVTATSQNQASSRSHCVFTMHLRSKQANSDVIRQSKFHFVDLAGSERVGKTGADGKVLEQAKYINSSLFYLEMVIHALAKKDPHVPYRNSMMTFFLRDSLGGNCKTCMLATLGFEVYNLQETISTCQFAQNVAMIKNAAVVNEDVDPKLLIKRLKEENLRLKEELKLLKEGDSANANKNISQDEENTIREIVNAYIANPDQSFTLDVGSWWKLQIGIRMMKLMILEGGQQSAQIQPVVTQKVFESDSEIERLKQLLQQRDAEIEILTQMVGGEADVKKEQVKGPMYDYEQIEQDYQSRPVSEQNEVEFPPNPSFQQNTVIQNSNSISIVKNNSMNSPPQVLQQQQKSLPEQQIKAQILSNPGALCKIPIASLTLQTLKSEQILFQNFLKTYYNNGEITSQKQLLKELYGQAKQLANLVQQQRGQAENLKAEILKIVEISGRETEESDFLKQKLAGLSSEYKEGVQGLRETKAQVEGLEAEIGRGKTQIKKDFVRWYKYAVQVVSQRIKQDTDFNVGVGDCEDDIKAFYEMKDKMGI
ncbi:Kinesin-like protein [Spironucleus salmonicida]|uniref:Kinesin-like protein n=1 Tax=Spironucleus salmonicida TaxID=348837 RepID=V6LZE4_9EUKA|nr:Kinesin-like protein [Spironucleus salmonicida]|eukprot:EST49121.1 Kinesin-9 [Spironucleus salmonicida]